MNLYVGTSGYSYKEWKGSFYPPKIAPAEMLAYYAERFRSVEINSTFHALPQIADVKKWAAQVPEGFRFTRRLGLVAGVPFRE